MICILWIENKIMKELDRVPHGSLCVYTRDGKVVQYVNDLELNRQNGQLCVLFGLGENPIPEELAVFVDKITLDEEIPLSPKRECGVYRYKTASGQLEVNMQNTEYYSIHITGKVMKDLHTLLHKIKAGMICPRQGNSYEAPQVDKKPVRDKLAEICRLVSNLNNLSTSWWPLISKKTVATKIKEVIDECS